MAIAAFGSAGGLALASNSSLLAASCGENDVSMHGTGDDGVAVAGTTLNDRFDTPPSAVASVATIKAEAGSATKASASDVSGFDSSGKRSDAAALGAACLEPMVTGCQPGCVAAGDASALAAICDWASCRRIVGPSTGTAALYCALFVVVTVWLLAAVQNFVYPRSSSIEGLVPLSAIGYRVLAQPQRRLAAWLRPPGSSERCPGSFGTHRGWRGDSRWISPVALLLCAGVAVGQDAALKAAVEKCVEEDPTGGCECAGTSCSPDARFQGKIGTWDVSGVESMYRLFYKDYGQFNGDISQWDTSSVTRMDGM